MASRTGLTDRLRICQPVLLELMDDGAEGALTATVRTAQGAGRNKNTLGTWVFDITRDRPRPVEFPGRGVANRFTERWPGREAELQHTAADTARYSDALADQDFETAVVWAGESADLIHSVERAGAIVTRIVAEAVAALGRRFN